MFANGEFCHTLQHGEFKDKCDLPVEAWMMMKNGEKRKVLIFLKRTKGQIKITVQLLCEIKIKDELFIFAMQCKDDNGEKILEKHTIFSRQEISSSRQVIGNVWTIRQYDYPNIRNITVFIQLLADETLSANREADNKINKNLISSLVEDYAAMRKSGLMSDITIVCEGVRLPTHKAVLSARSEVFAAMFSHKDNMENQKNEVLIDDVDIDTMEKFMSFLYEAALPEEFDFDCFANLLKVGDKYQVDSLTQACAAKLAENICTDNAVQAAILGFLCNNGSMKSKAIEAIVNRDKGVTLSSMKGYKELRSYPDLFTEIVDFGHGPSKPTKRKRESES